LTIFRECESSYDEVAIIYLPVYIIPIAGMPPHHRKINNSNFIIGIFTLPEDGQDMTETCRRFSKF